MDPTDNNQLKFNNPPIIPCDLISRKKIKQYCKDNKLTFIVYSNDTNDDFKYSCIKGKLYINNYNEIPWNISGDLFEKWIQKLKYNDANDCVGDLYYEKKVAYFDYYHLLPQH